MNTDEWEVIVKYYGDLWIVEAELGVKAELLGDSFAILTLRPSLIPELYNFKEIEYVELPKTLTLSLYQSKMAACITSVQNRNSFGLSGNGVIVGLIDSGIDYTHPDFRDADGNSRVLFLWDQLGTGQPPVGFRAGTEYTNSELNAALATRQPFDVIPPMDVLNHGTAVAGIAAGNGRVNAARRGVAPEASLIVVRLGERGRESFARTTEIMRALKYISDQASRLNMPVAINLSFGTNDGSHSGNTLFETFIDAVAHRWKSVIVAATGNEGSARHHFSAQIASGQQIDVEFVVRTSLPSLYLSMWKSFADIVDIELISPGGQSSGILNSVVSFRQMKLDGADVLINFGQPSFYHGDQEIYIQISRENAFIPQGIWRLRVTGRKIVEGTFHIWLPTIEEVGMETAFSVPDPSITLTLPSTAKNVISVGGYNASIGAAADFTGRGYTFQNVYVKPDLVAPAIRIMTTRTGGGYDTFTGTSMAAPFVTGSAALMMEWGIVRGNDPFLYGQRVKAFLQRGAKRRPSVTYPNPVWGYGTLCLRNTMDALAELNL